MAILGNLLNQALSVIPGECGELFKYLGREDNGTGMKILKFADKSETIYGSFQAVPRELYEKLGLEYKKAYLMVYTSSAVNGLDRGEAGDKVIYKDESYIAMTEGGWRKIDGWGGVMMVKVPND